jgi:hypothetical protein
LPSSNSFRIFADFPLVSPQNWAAEPAAEVTDTTTRNIAKKNWGAAESCQKRRTCHSLPPSGFDSSERYPATPLKLDPGNFGADFNERPV